MAAPVTHIVLTNKIFDKHFKDKNKKEFFIGTNFPDIRYLKVINRKETHFSDIKINDLVNENSFIAGFKFHSLIDKVQTKFMNLEKIYSLCPNSKYPAYFFVYLLIDELLYDKISKWSEFINFMDEIVSEELSFNISKKDIQKWHEILQNYFYQKPDNHNREKFITSIGFSKNDAININYLVNEIKLNKKINQIIMKLYNNFENILKEYD